MKALPKKLFRAYDIRGIANEDLTSQNAFQIGRSIGSQLNEDGSKQILLGRDGRLSSPRIADALIKGLISTGCHITDLGEIPTPALYFAIRHLGIPNGVVITGSHNPAEYNGIKIVLDQQCLHTNGITALYDRIMQKKLLTTNDGMLKPWFVLGSYMQAVLADVTLKRHLRIALDCGNGATSLLAVELFEKLGCDVYPLYCELDGHFPNHSPDPTQPKNLKDLQALVIKEKLDIGIAFDGDGDRMIAVDGNGKILWPDRIMVLLAQDILKQHPKRVVAFDVKCSQLLPQVIKESAGIPSMCISGHSLLKAHMKETQAIMGGEFSGHIVLNDRSWQYADDGLYVAARLLETLSNFKQTPTQVFSNLADSYSTPEYKLYFASYEAAEAGMNLLCETHDFHDAKLSFIDGLRADFKDCWGLARASNTTPTITLRFEALSKIRLEYIKERFRENLHRLDLPVCEYDGFRLDTHLSELV